MNRKPLVKVRGKVRELPDGDSLDASVVETLLTGENKDVVTIFAGQPVAVHSSGVGFVLADATAPGKEAVGLAQTDIAVGVSGPVLIDGLLQMDDWTEATGSETLAPRSQWFLSTVAGKLSTTAPTVTGNIVQSVARSVAPDMVKIEVDEETLL